MPKGFGMLGAYQPSLKTTPGIPVNRPGTRGQSLVNQIRSGTKSGGGGLPSFRSSRAGTARSGNKNKKTKTRRA